MNYRKLLLILLLELVLIPEVNFEIYVQLLRTFIINNNIDNNNNNNDENKIFFKILIIIKFGLHLLLL